MTGRGVHRCNSLHILGSRVLSGGGRCQVKFRPLKAAGAPAARLLASYLPLRTSLAMVANCMFEVPS